MERNSFGYCLCFYEFEIKTIISCAVVLIYGEFTILDVLTDTVSNSHIEFKVATKLIKVSHFFRSCRHEST